MADRDHDEEDEYLIDRPNRAKSSSQTARAVVIFVLIISVVLMGVLTVTGWSKLQGAKPLQIVYILIYLGSAFAVFRWSRGVLPLIASLALVLAIFAVVAGPGWIDRDRPGFAQAHGFLGLPSLDASMLGLLTLVLIPVQLLLLAFALQAFRQGWNVEVEVPADKAGPHAISRPAG